MANFQGMSYPTRDEMLRNLAAAWLTANGINSPAYVRETLAETNDETLAKEAIDNWTLADGGWDGGDATPSHMEVEGYNATDLAAAFAAIRGKYKKGDDAFTREL